MAKKSTIKVGETNTYIVSWLKDYAKNANVNGFVVGISGGVDSAVTSTLCAQTGLTTLCVEMPIHQNESHVNRGKEHIEQLKNRFSNSKVLDEQFKESEGWPYYKVIFDLRSDRDREKLFDSNMRKELVGDIHNQLFELLNECNKYFENKKYCYAF